METVTSILDETIGPHRVEVPLPSTDAPSPFLTATKVQFAWDSTSIQYLKRCPRLYQYKMIEGWQAKGESIHLRFGLEFHRAMQDYDKSRANGIPHNDAVFDTVNELLCRTGDFRPTEETHGRAGKYKTRDNLLRSVVWYLDQFEHDPAVTYIKRDETPAVELSFNFELDWGPAAQQPYLLCGHLDKVVDYQGGLYVMDYKTTTTTISEYFFNQFEPDNQMSLYTLAGQVVLDSPIRGVIINGIQVAIDFSRFVRGFTYRTEDQTREWLGDLRHWLGLAERYAIEGYWPQNDTACDKYGGCAFRKICSKAPGVREAFLEADFVRGEQWNPLLPR